MTQHDALLAAVCDAPDDDLPRLVYADWCDENGDPDRAEFIRTQIEIAKGAKGKKLAKLQAREQELLEENLVNWTAPLGEFIDAYYADPIRYHRGFAEDICTHCSTLPESGDELFRLAPIRRLHITDADEYTNLAQCSHLIRIRALDLTSAPLDHIRGTGDLFRSQYLADLEKLVVRGGGLDGEPFDLEGMSFLVRSKYFTRLRVLDLGENLIFQYLDAAERHATSEILAGMGSFHSLAELRLDQLWMSESIIVELASQPWLSRIRRLDLHRNHAGDIGGRALAESPHLENIEHLDLRNNDGFDPETGASSPMSDTVKRLLKRRFGKRVLLDGEPGA